MPQLANGTVTFELRPPIAIQPRRREPFARSGIPPALEQTLSASGATGWHRHDLSRRCHLDVLNPHHGHEISTRRRPTISLQYVEEPGSHDRA